VKHFLEKYQDELIATNAKKSLDVMFSGDANLISNFQKTLT
jgi:hypothetical protein